MRQAFTITVSDSSYRGGAGSLLRHRPFLLFFCSCTVVEFSYQTAAVALGWPVYAPIYARDMLHTGAWGWEFCAAHPVGALTMTAVLARHAIQHSAGRRMLQAVIVFGLATMPFAVSREVWLSLLALQLLGAAD